MRAASDGRQLQLYNQHAADSATAWRRRRLSPGGRGMYAASFGSGGVLREKIDGGRLRKYRGSGDLYRNPGRIRSGKHASYFLRLHSLDLCKIYRPFLDILLDQVSLPWGSPVSLGLIVSVEG